MTKTALVLLATGVLLSGFLVYVANKPGDFRIERSAFIRTSPHAAFEKVNSLKEFNTWNPFAAMDPTIQFSYSGPAEGVGASYAWTGTGKAGAGNMTILEASPSSHVTMKLQFEKPMTATNQADFAFAPEGAGTRVTWTMTGHNGYVQKLFATVFNMDKMVGTQFSDGLKTLQSQLEH
jgi:Polyketide cyclase / dehydrase and lipid transport